MELSASEILEMIHKMREHTIVVAWNGAPLPDTSKECWEFHLTNTEDWPANPRSLSKYYIFPVAGVEHGKRVFADICMHFRQPEALHQFHANGLNTGRAIFLMIKVTIGRLEPTVRQH